MKTAEGTRLDERNNGEKDWALWGNYLAERQWGTVREDYSAGGDAWEYLTHDAARSRAYRWGEDGLAGICDDKQRMCFALALWNGQDAILKERLFGLTNGEGNHGEDVKELYYYLDNLPSHAFMKTLYKYPQTAFPYEELLSENKNRSRLEPEFELLDTGIFNENRYFDVETTYAKADIADILIEIKITNRATHAAPIWVLPTLWFRNRWTFEDEEKPILHLTAQGIETTHPTLGDYFFSWQTPPKHVFFTENETNHARLFGSDNTSPFVKDAFHEAIIHQNYNFLSKNTEGSKSSPVYELNLQGGETVVLKFRLSNDFEPFDFESTFDNILKTRQDETHTFYSYQQGNSTADSSKLTADIRRQSFAGLLWSKQFYEYDVARWLSGDNGLPPPHERHTGRNANWQHLKAADVILMPDKWEYPWFAAWDLAFHAVAIAPIDPVFAQNQLLLLFSERYMSPSGDLPAYEWRFDDTNPPIQAWAAWKIYRANPSIPFLKKAFDGLLPYYRFWIDQKDENKNNLFEGGFLGLDNISVFDRSAGIPFGGRLEQADGTAWMAFFAAFMLRISTELALSAPQYEKYCIEFFTNFEHIATALSALSDEETGLFFDNLALPDGQRIPLKIHSLVSLLPLLAAVPLEKETLDKLPHFQHAVTQFFNREDTPNESLILSEMKVKDGWFLSLITPERLLKLLDILGSESEMLSPFGVRSVSKIHELGFAVQVNDEWFGMKYNAGESDSGLFGGNSNWRGPIWLPMNALLIDSLKRYAGYYGDNFTVEFPKNSGQQLTLKQVAHDLSQRLWSLFLPKENGQISLHGEALIYSENVDFQHLKLFHEYFDADSGKGLGASHQTGWTALIGVLGDVI
jgi:Glycosyl hydrolase family 63 C-terminal domain